MGRSTGGRSHDGLKRWATGAVTSVALGGVVALVSIAPGTATAGVRAPARSVANPTAGMTWNVVPSANPTGRDAAFSSVTCPSATSCLAVGNWWTSTSASRRLLERWNGNTWSIEVTPAPSGLALGSVQRRRLLRTGCMYSGGRRQDTGQCQRRHAHRRSLERSRVDSRRAALSGAPPWLAAVACPASNACFAVGQRMGDDVTPGIEYWNGATWKLQRGDATEGLYTDLASIKCVGPANCTAVGTNLEGGSNREWATIQHWDGRHWTLQSPAALPRRSQQLAVERVVLRGEQLPRRRSPATSSIPTTRRTTSEDCWNTGTARRGRSCPEHFRAVSIRNDSASRWPRVVVRATASSSPPIERWNGHVGPRTRHRTLRPRGYVPPRATR